MPAGIPVGTLAIGRAGAVNAALLAAAILALADPDLAGRLDALRAEQTALGAAGTGGAAGGMNLALPPNSTIGIVGGGQLGRMSALAAARLGYRCHILTPSRTAPPPWYPPASRSATTRTRRRCAPSPPRSM